MSDQDMTTSAKNHFEGACIDTGVSSRERTSWLIARRAGIGGSDAATIMGANPFSSELALYVDKTSDDPQPKDDAGEPAQWGNIFEPAIIREYNARSKRRVVTGGRILQSRKAPHYLVTLDGVQLRRAPAFARGKGPGVAEIKTTGYGERYEEDIPVEVQIQCQWEMFVTGAAWATCVWLPFPERKLQWRDIEPHPEFQALLAERVDAFWQRVVKRNPPDPDGSAASKLAIRRMFPEDNGEVIRLLGAVDAADEYERCAAAIKLLQSRQAEIKNMLAYTIGEAKYAVLDDGRYFGSATYKAREVKCPECDHLLSQREGYRTHTLRKPKKKPFQVFDGERMLQMPPANDDLLEQLEASNNYLDPKLLAKDIQSANETAAEIKTGTES
jgi:putative phage-type endonuclease